MDSLTDTGAISRLEIVDTGRRRRVGRGFQLAQDISHGATWRRWVCPAMIVPEPPAKDIGSGCGRIEIVSTNGRRVMVDRDVEVEVLLRILRGLETLP
jgi:transposase